MSPDTPVTMVDLADQAASLAPGLPSRVIGRINESCLRLSVFAGEGNWHAHPTSDELFVVLEGELLLDVFAEGTVAVGPGQVVTVPAGVMHRPRAEARTVILCFKHLVAETEYYEYQGESPDLAQQQSLAGS